MALLLLSELNTNAGTKTSLLSYHSTSKFFSKKILEAHRPLLIIFKVNLEKTHSIS